MRFRFQFSIRTLLILTVLAAVPLAWLRWEIEKKRTERQTIAAIVRSGGSVHYDPPLYIDAAGMLPGGKPSGRPWCRVLLGDDFFATVRQVHCGRDATDAELVAIGKLEGVEELTVTGVPTSAPSI